MRKHNILGGASIPYYGVAILWILLSMLQQSNRIVVAMILSIATFVFLQLIKQEDESPSQLRRPVEDLLPKPNEKLNQEIQKGAVSIQALKQIMTQIKDAKVRGKILELEALSKRILNEVEECPEKVSQIKTFVDYYFPTTLNILNAYRRVEAAGIEGENINRTKHQIEATLDSSILVVFRRQLDSLFGADALDISVELSVLQNMMAREGITGEKLKTETIKNGDGTDIRLTL